MSDTHAVDPESAFSGRIKRVWTSPFYFLGLVIVALAMLLLPIIYLGIITCVGYLLFYHATENVTIFSGRTGRGIAQAKLFLYLAPLIVGAILLVFMVKPLFARPARRDKRVSLVRDREPRLFAFVDRLCEVVGSPKPKRIDLNCEVNASASLRHGLWSTFLPGDLVLTIGLPIVAGLSLRDFTGVVAHEFGHFAQGLGMRFSYLIATVNAWFARVVYQRDSWDEWLIDACQSDSGWITVVMYLARMFVAITRGILWLLMMLGHAISCGMSRQMEYNADMHAIRATGSESFTSTQRGMTLLSVAEQAVYQELRETWRDGKLADNLPACFANKVADMPQTLREKIIADVEAEKTTLFNTHPSDAARIRRADKANDPGVFLADGPATDLFTDFAGVAKSITLSHYRDFIGPQVTPQNLISTADLDRRRNEARKSDEAAGRYFLGCLTLRRPLLLDAYSKNMKLAPADAQAQLANLRAQIAKHQSAIRDRFSRYIAADERVTGMEMLSAVLRAGGIFTAKDFDLPEATLDAVNNARQSAHQTRVKLTPELGKIETVMKTRAEIALGLLSADALAKRVRNIEKLRARTNTLMSGLHVVSSVCETAGKMRAALPGMAALSRVLSDNPDNEEGVRHAMRLAEEQHIRIGSLRESLMHHDYPFPHASGKITMARYAVPKLPERKDFGGVYYASQELHDNLNALYVRMLGDLALICEAVESVLGMKPLPIKEVKPAESPSPSQA